MGTASQKRNCISRGNRRWQFTLVLLRSARAHGTSTFAQSNGPHSDKVTKLDVIITIEVAAMKLNIFRVLEKKHEKLETIRLIHSIGGD